MLSKLYNFYILARESLFYTPAVICLLYALGCYGVYAFESTYTEKVENIPFIYNGTLEKAQDIVDTLLGAMITMTTLVISVTMVVLSLSASQHGPRLMKIFMRNQVTKIFIGMFFGSVAACFILTGILHDAASEAFLPRLTTSTVFASCFLNLFVLLAYVQHVAKLSISDNLVTLVYNDLCAAIKRMEKKNTHKKQAEEYEPSPDFNKKARPVLASHNNYIQTIDYDGLCEIAAKNNLVLRMRVKPGDYIIQGAALLDIYPKSASTSEVEKDMEGAIVYGYTRSASQDIEYSVRHMVEIALRALSPGINDDFTALFVLNKLTAAMVLIYHQGFLQHVYRGKSGKVRVIAKQTDAGSLVFNAYTQIRNAAREKPAVLLRMLELLTVLKSHARTREEHDAVEEQVNAIKAYVDIEFDGRAEAAFLSKAVNAAKKSSPEDLVH